MRSAGCSIGSAEPGIRTALLTLRTDGTCSLAPVVISPFAVPRRRLCGRSRGLFLTNGSMARAPCHGRTALLVAAACQPARRRRPRPLAPDRAGPVRSPLIPARTRGHAGRRGPEATAAPPVTLTFTMQTYPRAQRARIPTTWRSPPTGASGTRASRTRRSAGWTRRPARCARRICPNGAAPHGVITGPDGAAWVTDQGLDAIVRVTPGDFDVDVFQRARLGTARIPASSTSTGSCGSPARPASSAGSTRRPATSRRSRRRAAPGRTASRSRPSNEVWFVSLQQSYLGKVDKATGEINVIEPPTPGAGTRRVWSDSTGRLWISYWNAGMVAVYDPAAGASPAAARRSPPPRSAGSRGCPTSPRRRAPRSSARCSRAWSPGPGGP